MNDREILKSLTDVANSYLAVPSGRSDIAWRNRLAESVGFSKEHLAKPRRTVVCLCGSTRFKEAYEKAQENETLAGKIVLTVGMFGHMEGPVKAMLDQLYLDKINMADEVLILNVGGYVGSSTVNEIKHAMKRGKKIRWLDPSWIHDYFTELLDEKDRGA